MTYEEASAEWMRRRLNIVDPNIVITEVTFGQLYEISSGCDTCGYGGYTITDINYNLDGVWKFLELRDAHFGTIVIELFDISAGK